MPRKRWSEEQIVYAVKQSEAGRTAAEICRELGVSQQTFYTWKRRYRGIGVQELRELRQLRDENRTLKRVVADLTLDRHILQEIVSKKLSRRTPSRAGRVGAGQRSGESTPGRGYDQ